MACGKQPGENTVHHQAAELRLADAGLKFIPKDEQTSKRELFKKAAYVAPMILTLKVTPTFG